MKADGDLSVALAGLIPGIVSIGAMMLLYSGRYFMETCEERVVVALERAGVDVAQDAPDGVITVAIAVRAIEHIASCWRDEAARAITRARDAKRWEAKAKALEKEVSAYVTKCTDYQVELGKRTRELETVKAEATTKIAEQSATIERMKGEMLDLCAQLDAKAKRRRRV